MAAFYGNPLSVLSATRYIRRLPGRTQAHLMRGSDGFLYVTKFQNNPHSTRVLASEFLATRLGLWLGLPMPQAEIIDVPEWLVNHALLRIESENRLIRCASGRQLALRYVPDALKAVPRRSFERIANRLDFIQVLAFDKWVGNCDHRQAVFVKDGLKGYHVVFIDQHQCFNADRWTFPDMPNHGIHEHLHVYREVTGLRWFEPMLSRIEKITRFDLWKIAMDIPPEWYQHDSDALSELVERLYRRRMTIRNLIKNPALLSMP